MAVPSPAPDRFPESIPDNSRTLGSRFEELVARDPDAKMLSQAMIHGDGSRSQSPSSRRDIQRQVHRVSNWLREDCDIQHADRVGIISATWPEAGVCDMAVLDAGGCNAILYPTDQPQDIAYKLWISQPQVFEGQNNVHIKTVFADNQSQVDKLYRAQEKSWEFEHPVTKEPVTVNLNIDRVVSFSPANQDLSSSSNMMVSWLDNVLANDSIPDTPPPTLKNVSGNDLAYFIFTSGSTSLFPKAVEVRHSELVDNLDATYSLGMFEEGETAFLPIPLSHSFGQHFKLQSFVNGLVVAYPAVWDDKNSDLTEEAKLSIVRDLSEANADNVPTVPSMLSKFRKKIIAKSQKGMLGLPLKVALWSHGEVLKAEQEGKKPPLLASIVKTLSHPIAKKVQKTLYGDNFKFSIPGGGFLDPEIFDFFKSLGMKTCPGYGFTEASVVVAVVHPDRPMPGSVGEILDSFEVDVRKDDPADEVGRLFFRGESITKGYANNPAATSRALSPDGWYDSQDYGYVKEVNGKRYLYLVGRSEDREVLSTGENIAVVPIQEHLKQSRFINEIIITGQDRKFLVGLVDVDKELVYQEQVKRGINSTFFSEQALENAAETIVMEAIRRREDELGLKSYQRTKYIHILKDSPSIANGMLTPTHKIKRGKMIETHRDTLEEMWKRTR